MNNIRSQKAVISGANGFIASHLIRALRQINIDIVPVPRSYLYHPPKLQSLLATVQPDYIFHLAAYGNHGIQIEEEKIIFANYIATWNMLSASKTLSYKAFVNFSTSSIYGKKDRIMKESDYLVPDTFYAATKAGATHLARAYVKTYDKPIVNVVPFSVYGEGEADFRFMPTICKHLVKGGVMPFVSYPTHDWIYVEDFIRGVLIVADSIEKVKGKSINISTGRFTNNKQVLRLFEKVAKKKVNIEENYKEQPHHSGVWYGDNSVLKSLGWKPQYTLGEGVKRTYEYYQQRFKA